MTQRAGSLSSVISGNLSLNARQGQQIAATFAGAGNFSIGAAIAPRAIVTFAEFFLVQSGAKTGAVRFAGSGTLSAYARSRLQAAADFDGLGNLQVNVNQHMVAAARFTGAGALSVDATQVTGAQVWQAYARFGAETAFLLHADGSDGSQVFIDSSPIGHRITVTADTQIDTAQSKFGGASALFDGVDDFLTIDGGA